MAMRAGLVATMLLVNGAATVDFTGLWNPFKTPLEGWTQQIDEARTRGDLDLAQSLADDAERALGTGLAPLVRQRGLIARDRAHLPEASELLGKAAQLDPTSDARLEQAAVLIPMGRWPEAVEVLERAFDERGASLRIDDIVVDPRVSPLAGFAPFQDLIRRVRADQSGPFGRMLLKFERMDDAVAANRSVLDVLGTWMQAWGRLGAYPGTAVVVLLGLGLLVTFGVNQTGLARPPWTLIGGMGVASGLWYLGARVARGAPHAGLVTIATALGVVFLPWGGALAIRWWLRRRAHRRFVDPFATAQLKQTLALIEDVRRLTTQALALAAVQQDPQLLELRSAAKRLGELLQAGRQ